MQVLVDPTINIKRRLLVSATRMDKQINNNIKLAMEFSLPPRQKLVTSRGYQYSYVHIPSAAITKATLLLIHGWPSHIDDWIFQVRYFAARGYGIIAPDMLGYGDSSAPSDTSAYRLSLIARDLAEILDQEQLQRVVGIGHDWGATILSRFAMYNPERLSALILLGIGASKPGTKFDLDAINEMTKKATGSEMLGYIAYISRDPGSHCAMERNAESVMSVLFAADPECWNHHLRPLDGFTMLVETGNRVAIGDWFPQELREKHLELFGKTDGHLGPSQYYKMLDQNLSVPDEEQLVDFRVVQPVLLVIPREPTASSHMQSQMLSAWASDLEVVQLDSGHWVHMEKSEETNRALEEFLRKHDVVQE
jgi:soluble epoxide hydrolase / lipid-phosphate phosphatase